MKEIFLTQGQVAKIDDEDHERINKHKWCALKSPRGFYAIRMMSSLETKNNGGVRNIVRMHRFIMDTPKGMDTDHIDGNGLNNQRKNLRIATRSQNAINVPTRRDNTSGIKGVVWYKQTKRWRAQINIGKKRTHLGFFIDKTEAIKAYNEAAKKHFGDFASLNKI